MNTDAYGPVRSLALGLVMDTAERMLLSHGVRGIFEQGSGDVLHSDMAPLKAYLIAKLLWNPDYDEGQAISEFLAAYYGLCHRSVPPGLLKRALDGQTHQARMAIRAHPPVRIAPPAAHQTLGATFLGRYAFRCLSLEQMRHILPHVFANIY